MELNVFGVAFVFFFGLIIIWGIVRFFEEYGYIISETMKYAWRIIWHAVVPKNIGVRRLCLIVGVFLAVLSFVEIPRDFGLGQIICNARACYLFGEPYWITAVVVFCIPFIMAKLIEFIVAGFKDKK